MKDKQPLRESDVQREDRYWKIAGTGAYLPEGWKIPHLTSPPESSKPETVDRAREQVEALKSAKFSSMLWTERKDWNDLQESEKFDNLRHWVDWDGVNRTDRARLIGGQVNAYELVVSYIPLHERHAAIDFPELIEQAMELADWKRGQQKLAEATPSAVPALPSSGDHPRRPWPSEIAEANRNQQGKGDGKEHSHGHDDGHSM